MSGERLGDVIAAAAHESAGGVRYDGIGFSYGDLMDRAGAPSRELREQGVGPGTVVAISQPPGPLLIISILAVVSAGACYVYVDPEWPLPHQTSILERSGARFVIAQDNFSGVAVLALGSRPDVSIPAEVACLISTSGTTGGPRMVGLSHAGILHLVRDANLVRLGPQDRLLALAHPGFGAALWEIWAAIDAGAELVYPRDRRMSLHDLASAVAASGASVAHFSAGIFRQFDAEHIRAMNGLRLVMTGGDTVAPRQFRAAYDILDGDLVACYGCTENTVFTSLYQAGPETNPDRPVPLGRPLANTGLQVLTEDLRPVEPGEVGELYVSGAGLAVGYVDDPDRTRDRFGPLGAGAERVFRTGDFARRLADGSYELTGRRDRQVQVRGFRVELADIEITLRQLDSVDDVCAVQLDRPDGDRQIVAAVIASHAAAPLESEVRAYARERMPDFMVPDRVVTVESLPLTERGKVDRRKLAELMMPAGPVTALPSAAVVDVVRRVWTSVLGRDDVADDLTFTAVGGHSLQAIQVIHRIGAELGVEVSIREFYAASTIRGLGRLVMDNMLRDEREDRRPVAAGEESS